MHAEGVFVTSTVFSLSENKRIPDISLKILYLPVSLHAFSFKSYELSATLYINMTVIISFSMWATSSKKRNTVYIISPTKKVSILLKTDFYNLT